MNIDLKRHPETDLLIARLRDVPLGQEIGYADLSRVIGRDVRTAARPRLTSAREIALRDHGVCFFAIRGVGLRRITVQELPQVGAHARGRAKSAVRGGLKTISAVMGVSNGVEPETMRKVASERAALGLLAEVASDSAQAAFDTDKAAMPPAIAGAAFLRHIGAISTEEAA
jgi:hypothetical protein